ncbi:MAG: quinolinate synthase NadA [Deltaproteobacteria bacterium]|nr:quinolinate synthase NadA [Deltaproteobacteria bacterium]
MEAPLEIIRSARERLGKDLVILTHHYQRPEVVAFGDFIGDSFMLAREASRSTARIIVFCGVHFMTEAACILARPDQQVYMPDPQAGCPMADMADADDVSAALQRIAELVPHRRIVPVAYINSSAAVKAIVGRAGGLCCTSSNAQAAVRHALTQGDLVLFLPDEFLGTNTAHRLGQDTVPVYNPHAAPRADGDQPTSGGLAAGDLENAKVVVWKGYCHVHTWFSPEMVAAAREKHPGCSIVVHPECRPEVLALADGSGSTAWLVEQVREASPGATVIIGTEVNLVLRLAHSLCPNMYRTTVSRLARLLQSFPEQNRMSVDPSVTADARLALDRMLALA